MNKRDQFAVGLAQLQLGMTPDAPPVALSRVGRCELPCRFIGHSEIAAFVFIASMGGWPTLDLQTTLQGAPFKLRLGGVFGGRVAHPNVASLDIRAGRLTSS